MKRRRILRSSIFSMVIGTAVLSSLLAGSAQIDGRLNTGTIVPAIPKSSLIPPNQPKEIDVRGPHGVPKGISLSQRSPVQLEAI